MIVIVEINTFAGSVIIKFMQFTVILFYRNWLVFFHQKHPCQPGVNFRNFSGELEQVLLYPQKYLKENIVILKG